MKTRTFSYRVLQVAPDVFEIQPLCRGASLDPRRLNRRDLPRRVREVLAVLSAGGVGCDVEGVGCYAEENLWYLVDAF